MLKWKQHYYILLSRRTDKNHNNRPCICENEKREKDRKKRKWGDMKKKKTDKKSTSIRNKEENNKEMNPDNANLRTTAAGNTLMPK